MSEFNTVQIRNYVLPLELMQMVIMMTMNGDNGFDVDNKLNNVNDDNNNVTDFLYICSL